MPASEVKSSGVTTSESLDTMATLPISVSRQQQAQHASDKSSAAAKEKEAEAKATAKVASKAHFVYHQIKRTSTFVVLSLLYGKLVIVACIGFVVSQELTRDTKNVLPTLYYEGFFTILFGVSIVFLLYLFCFLLQDSSCCPGNRDRERKPAVKKAPKKADADKNKKKDKNKKDSGGEQSGARNRPNVLQREVFPRKIKDKTKSKEDAERLEGSTNSTDADEKTSLVGVGAGKKGKNTSSSEEKLTEPSPDSIDIEASSPECEVRRRKTSQNLHHYGSFFLRVGAIGFGLGTMIYIGLQFGQIFEIPLTSPCYDLLKVVNPILQMVFTFMQMYFIFMNARLKIHRFKFIARFGLMHVMATNICVWIKTLVYEILDAVKRDPDPFLNSTKQVVNVLKTEYGTMMGQGKRVLSATSPRSAVRSLNQVIDSPSDATRTFFGEVNSNIRQIPYALVEYTTNAFSTTLRSTTASTTPTTTLPTTAPTTPSTTPYVTTSTVAAVTSTIATTISRSTNAVTQTLSNALNINSILQGGEASNLARQTERSAQAMNLVNSSVTLAANLTANLTAYTERPAQAMKLVASVDTLAEALRDKRLNITQNVLRFNDSCGRWDIMGNVVHLSAPYLYPFVIEYSLIGAAVIYIMWRHIGRSPRYVSEENIEHRLEAILSQKAVAMAHVQAGGRVDCIGASKGLFFGLLTLVGSSIAMLLFFVLIYHEQFKWLAIYLADAAHSVVMILSILAIIIGFCRAKSLRFYAVDTTDLNDILLRVSAFGLFVYSTFSVIAGAKSALTEEKNLLVLISGSITIIQVVLQLLFIGDMSRRHVYLPEHDRNKPGRQIVTFLLICNLTMWILFTFESKKVAADPVQPLFYGKRAWLLVEHLTLPLCIFHRFHSAVALAEIWKNSYKPRLD